MSPRMEVVARQPQLEVALISSQGGGYPRHTHEEYVLSANLSGQERIWFDGKEQEVAPGQVTLYNPLTMQASTFGEDTRFISLHLSQERVKSLLDEAGLLPGQSPPAFMEGVHQIPALFHAILDLHRHPSANQREEALVRLLAALQRSSDPAPRLLQGGCPNCLTTCATTSARRSAWMIFARWPAAPNSTWFAAFSRRCTFRPSTISTS